MDRNYLNQIKELKNFLILWISQSFSTLGSSMTNYALLIWVYQQKQSTIGVALLAVCTYLPSVLLSFLAGTFVEQNPTIWIVFNFLGNLPLSLLNANMMFIIRTHIPIEMQGRVFSARDTLQYCTIPLGYLLGGILADYIFEPFMNGNSAIKHLIMPIVGDGRGSGIALMFLFTGVSGTIISLLGLMNKEIRTLDKIASSK